LFLLCCGCRVLLCLPLCCGKAETWHDSDSVSIRCLRADGFQVIERARPRRRGANPLLTNHGGVAAVAVLGVRLTQLELEVKSSFFECLCGRVASGSSSCIVVIIYRPGSEAVPSSFWSELSDVFDRLVTYADPMFVVGDVNVHLEAPIAARRFNDLRRFRWSRFDDDAQTWPYSRHSRNARQSATTNRRDASCRPVGPSFTSMVSTARMSDPGLHVCIITRRQWRALDRSSFRNAIRSSPL